MKFFDTYLHADDVSIHVDHQHASTIKSSHWHFVESFKYTKDYT